MNKFSFKSIRLIIVALVAGLLTPISASVAVDTVTKTFTVRAADNSLLKDAIVQVVYLASDAATTYTRPTAVVTDVNGVAAVTVPKGVPWLFYNIVPKAGDTTNAATSADLTSTSDEAIAVKLEAANFVLEVQSASGGTPPVGAVVVYPTGDGTSSAQINPVRSGAFGLRLGTNLNTASTYGLSLLQYKNEYAPGQFSYTYGLKASGASGSQTYAIYTDTTATTLVNATSGVYVLKYDASNLTGTIKNADGSTFVWPGTTGIGSLRVAPVATSWPGEAASQYPLNGSSSQLTWYARSRGTPGKYVLAASFPGSLTVPSFITDIWKNSSNAFALSENGTYTTSPHTLDIRFPSRGVNFAWKYVVAGTTTMEGFSYTILRDELINGKPQSIVMFSSHGGTTGFGSLSLADGTYKIVINAYSGTSNEYKIDVTSGVSVLKTIAGTTITKPSDGIYVLSPTPVNLKVKVVSSANSTTVIQNANVWVYNGADGKGGFVQGRNTGTGSADFTLPDGIYLVTANAGNEWGNYKDTSYVVTVSGGVASITSKTPDGSGVFSLGVDVKNFKFTLLEPSPSTTPLIGWINYCTVDSNGNQTACWGEGVNSSGDGGAALNPSTTYRINVYPPNTSAYSQSSYTATVNASGVVSLSPSATVVNSRFVLRPASSNVTGTLVDASNNNIVFGANQGMSIQVQKKDVNGNWNWYPLGTWRNTPTWGFNITEDGNYRILANPQGWADYAWSFSSEFFVFASGTKFSTVSNTDVSAKSSFTGSDALKIVMKVPNLKLTIKDPRTNELMKYGWAAIFKKETNGNETWQMNADLNSNNPGITGAFLSDGNYRIELNPQYNGSNISGLTKKNYDLVVTSGTATVSYKGTTISPVDGRVTVTPSTSNVTGKIVDSTGAALLPGNNQWVSVNLQKFNSSNNNWEWTNNWSNTDKDGFISMTVTDAGQYRLRIEPNGYASSTVTTTDPFTVDAGSEATFSKAFGDIKLNAPSLRVKVTLSNSNTAINYTGVEIRKNNNWMDWVGTGPTGVANIAFTSEGSYQIVVYPQQEQLASGATRKSYDVAVTKNSSGAYVATVTGLTATDGVYTLALGTGNVQGFVYTPGNGSTTPVRDAQVVAINTANNQEMWEYSTNTTATGKFTMNLPVGTYKIMARAPWGTNDYGNSDQIGTVTVTSGGVTVSDAFSSLSGTTLVVQLKAPTWKGTVRTPTGVTDAPVPYAQVCLWNNDRWDCTTANEAGQWSLSAPTGFTAFSSNAAFEIGDVRNRLYPSIRVDGAANVLALIGLGGSDVPSAANTTTSTTLVNRFPAANVKITVTAGGVAQPNVWVSLDRPNVGWLGGNSTNSQGVASFYVADITQAMNARVEFNGNPDLTGKYAPTFVEFSASQVGSATSGTPSTVNLTVPLATPNFIGVVTESSTNTAPVQWSWIELFEDANNQWKGGSNTDSSGRFAMNIAKPSSGDPLLYTLVVNPPWNATGSASKRTYSLSIDTAGVVILKDKNTGAVIGTTTSGTLTYHPMTLGTPSITGTVVSGSPEVGVRDSWVVPISATTGEWFWQQGQNTKAGGTFGLAVPDGTYNVQAQVPWNVTGLTKSAQCAVTITSGAISSAGTSCNLSNGSIKLKLREPNLTMTLVQAGVAVPYANVGIGIGNWSTNAQADSQGRISLFVDKDAVVASNAGVTYSNKIRVWVDPPYGNSNMVRWDCSSGDAKPVCATLPDFNPSADYPTTALGNVTVLGPNTRFKVTLPGVSTAVGANAWISVLAFVPSVSCCNWVAGGNTGTDGFASFNIDTSTVTSDVRYKIEVNPRWEDRSTYSRTIYDNGGAGYTIAQLNDGRTFAVGTPNSVITVRAADNTANKWGWIGISEINKTTNNWVDWVGGYGLDNLGKTAVTLTSDKRYLIEAYAGGGKSGTRTTCIVQSDTSTSTILSVVSGLCNAGSYGANNALTLTLNAGNVIGTVKTSGVVVAGAIVYANVVGATTQDNAVTTTTNELGKFGLNLDPSKGQWQISIFPVNKPGATRLANKILTAFTAPSLSSLLDLGDITLVP